MSEQEYENMINRLFEIANKGDIDAFGEIYSENCVFHSPPPQQDIIGLQNYKNFLTAFYAAYPDAHFTVEENLVSGNYVTTRWHYEATHSGVTPARRIPPTGKRVNLSLCSVARIENNKIVDDWTYSDQSILLEQLGVLTPVV